MNTYTEVLPDAAALLNAALLGDLERVDRTLGTVVRDGRRAWLTVEAVLALASGFIHEAHHPDGINCDRATCSAIEPLIERIGEVGATGE